MSIPPNPAILPTTNTALPIFTYTPIHDQNLIRILCLQGAQRHDAALVCRFAIINSEDVFNARDLGNDAHAPENYEALSWCWGDQERNMPIEIYENGEAYQFMITETLDEALRGLRSLNRVRYLWVDFLCIDQTSRIERNKLVPQMRMIYGGARSVCVWVGPGTATTEDAFEFIRKLLDVWDFDQIAECFNIHKLLNAFWQLVSSPWFSRRWIIQEIALARQATLHCGPHWIDWAEFADAVSLFVVNESVSHVFSSIMTDYKNIRDAFNHASEMGAAILIEATSTLFRVPREGKGDPLLSLEYLISKYTVFEARQPRDTIYALLAISKDTIAKPRLFKLLDAWESGLIGSTSTTVQLALRAFGRRKILAKDFQVDYHEPVIDVYRRFIQFAIERSEPNRALDILCRPWAPRFTEKDEGAGFHEALDGNYNFTTSKQKTRQLRDADKPVRLPSWVGTQDEKPFAMKATGGQAGAFQKMHRTNADPLVGHPVAGQRTYTANGSSGLRLDDVKFLKRDDFYSMFVKGFIIDEVKKVEAASQDGMIPARWLETGGWLNLSFPPPDDFWRTLIANRGPNSDNAPPFYKRACKEAWQGLRTVDNLNTSELISEGGSSVVRAFLQRVQAVTWRRSLIETKARRLGLVYPDTLEGDFICILDGCSVPVILRRNVNKPADVQKLREQREIDEEEKLRRAVALLGTMRQQQLRRRAENAVWQRKQRWLRVLRKARSYWLLYGFLLYLGSAPTSSAILDLCLVFTALSATSSTEMKVLGYRPIQRACKYWWKLAENPPMIRALLLFLATIYSSHLGQISKGLGIMLAVSMLLFPALLLRPVGLERAINKRNMRWVLTVPWKTASLFICSFQIRLCCVVGALMPWNWRLFKTLAPMYPEESIPEPRFDDDIHFGCWWQLIGPAYVHGIMEGEAIGLRNQLATDITEAVRQAKKDGIPLSSEFVELQRKKIAQRQVFELR